MKNDIKQAFGRILRELRAKRDMSQAELSAHTGIDRAYISELERGRLNPSLNTIVKLSSALNSTPSDLIRHIEDPSNEVNAQMGRNFSNRLHQEIGSVLTGMRKNAGLTISELSIICDVSRDHLSKLERGSSRMHVLMLYKLAAGLGCQPAEILKLADKRMKKS